MGFDQPPVEKIKDKEEVEKRKVWIGFKPPREMISATKGLKKGIKSFIDISKNGLPKDNLSDEQIRAEIQYWLEEYLKQS